MRTRREAMAIVTRAHAELEKIYGERLRGVYLFGSWARGQAGRESDVDIAVVLDAVPDYLVELERTSDLFSTLGLETGVLVSRVFIPEADFRTGRYALYRAIQREGLPL